MILVYTYCQIVFNRIYKPTSNRVGTWLSKWLRTLPAWWFSAPFLGWFWAPQQTPTIAKLKGFRWIKKSRCISTSKNKISYELKYVRISKIATISISWGLHQLRVLFSRPHRPDRISYGWNCRFSSWKYATIYPHISSYDTSSFIFLTSHFCSRNDRDMIGKKYNKKTYIYIYIFLRLATALSPGQFRKMSWGTELQGARVTCDSSPSSSWGLAPKVPYIVNELVDWSNVTWTFFVDMRLWLKMCVVQRNTGVINFHHWE